MSTTTYFFRDLEPEDYRRDEVTPRQKAKDNAIFFGAPDPDVGERVVADDGTTTEYFNEVQPDGSVVRKEVF